MKFPDFTGFHPPPRPRFPAESRHFNILLFSLDTWFSGQLIDCPAQEPRWQCLPGSVLYSIAAWDPEQIYFAECNYFQNCHQFLIRVLSTPKTNNYQSGGSWRRYDADEEEIRESIYPDHRNTSCICLFISCYCHVFPIPNCPMIERPSEKVWGRRLSRWIAHRIIMLFLLRHFLGHLLNTLLRHRRITVVYRTRECEDVGGLLWTSSYYNYYTTLMLVKPIDGQQYATLYSVWILTQRW